MIRLAAKFCALPPASRAIVMHSLLLLPAAAWLLRVRGFVRTRQSLARMAFPARGYSAPAAAEIARLVHRTAALLHIGCLARALVVDFFLRGHPGQKEIRFGVRRSPTGVMGAHAWLEFDGQPVGDSPGALSQYAALPSIRG